MQDRRVGDGSLSAVQAALGSYRIQGRMGRGADRIDRICRRCMGVKTCSQCGYVNGRLKLTDRGSLCPCGCQHDRDLNAGINITRRGTINVWARFAQERGTQMKQ